MRLLSNVLGPACPCCRWCSPEYGTYARAHLLLWPILPALRLQVVQACLFAAAVIQQCTHQVVQVCMPRLRTHSLPPPMLEVRQATPHSSSRDCGPCTAGGAGLHGAVA